MLAAQAGNPSRFNSWRLPTFHLFSTFVLSCRVSWLEWLAGWALGRVRYWLPSQLRWGGRTDRSEPLRSAIQWTVFYKRFASAGNEEKFNFVRKKQCPSSCQELNPGLAGLSFTNELRALYTMFGDRSWTLHIICNVSILLQAWVAWRLSEYNRNVANKFCRLPWSVQDLSPNIVYVMHGNMTDT